jgi:predicted nucleic acid-binding protein
MTHQAPAISQVLVLDAMLLIHFGRAERLDVLRDLLVDKECWTTRVVLEEVRQGAAAHPQMPDVDAGEWLGVAQLDTFEEIALFAAWARRIGSGERDRGEASVFAVAELRSATAITDDQEAVRVARTYGLDAHGTIWLLSGACRDGKLSEPAAGNLLDALRGTDSGCPAQAPSFPASRVGMDSCRQAVAGGTLHTPNKCTAPVEPSGQPELRRHHLPVQSCTGQMVPSAAGKPGT